MKGELGEGVVHRPIVASHELLQPDVESRARGVPIARGVEIQGHEGDDGVDGQSSAGEGGAGEGDRLGDQQAGERDEGEAGTSPTATMNAS